MGIGTGDKVVVDTHVDGLHEKLLRRINYDYDGRHLPRN